MTTTRITAGGSRRARLARGLAAIIAGTALVLGGATAAQALPPDGPGPDTAGTSSRVWPTTVSPGDTLNFEVSGYPANSTVYIKIDDGTMCTDTSHGACVYATQALDSNGYASGSIVVPDSLGEGAHWLRMLATGDVYDSETGEKIGYNGYTRRGGNDFTVVAAGSGGSGDSGSGGSGGGSGSSGSDSAGSGSSNADGTVDGGSVTIDVDGTATPEPTSTSGSMDDITTNITETPAPVAGDAVNASSSVPLLGIGVLGAAVLLGGGLLVFAFVRRGKLAKAAAGGADAATAATATGTAATVVLDEAASADASGAAAGFDDVVSGDTASAGDAGEAPSPDEKG